MHIVRSELETKNRHKRILIESSNIISDFLKDIETEMGEIKNHLKENPTWDQPSDIEFKDDQNVERLEEILREEQAKNQKLRRENRRIMKKIAK